MFLTACAGERGGRMEHRKIEAAQDASAWNQPDRLILAALCLAIPLFLSFSTDLFNDGDTSWHLAAGRLIIDTMSVPDVDPFSFTFLGKPWVAHEWLAEVLMAGAFAAAGWSGLSLLTAFAVGALLLILGLEAKRSLPVVPVAVLLVAVFIVLSPFTLARPHVLAWPLLAAWTVLLLRARESGAAPPLAVAALMLLWANLHGSFVFGLVLIGPFALEALIESKDKVATTVKWGSFGLLSLLLSLATPHGVHGLLFPLQVSSMETLSLIREWHPTQLSDTKGFAVVVLGTLFFGFYRGLKLPPIRALLLILLVYLAFEHVRHQAVLAIVGGLILAGPIGRALQIRPFPDPQILDRRLIATVVAIVLVGSAVRLAIPMEQPQSGTNPSAAISAIPIDLRSQPVINAYSFGGPLILRGIRPYIDGRADMYGDDYMKDYERIMEGDMVAVDAAVARWGITWTILSPGTALVQSLDRQPGWRRVYADQWAVVHVRDPAV